MQQPVTTYLLMLDEKIIMHIINHIELNNNSFLLEISLTNLTD